MKATDIALAILILIFGFGGGIYFFLRMGITFPILIEDFKKFFGV
jgi:hypothetical protein